MDVRKNHINIFQGTQVPNTLTLIIVFVFQTWQSVSGLEQKHGLELWSPIFQYPSLFFFNLHFVFIYLYIREKRKLQCQETQFALFHSYFLSLNKYSCNHYLSVCLFGCPIITLGPLDRVPSNFIGETLIEPMGNVLTLVKNFYVEHRLNFLGKTSGKAGVSS